MTALHRTVAGPRRAGRAGRGFTLLELVIVGAVSSVLFLLLIRWVLTLGAASSATMDNAAAQRSADVARDAFASDIDAAVPCAPGVPSPVRSISPAAVTFTTTAAGSGLAQVTWQVVQSSGAWHLERVVRAGGGTDPCTFTATGVITTYDEHLQPVQSDRILAGDSAPRPAFYTITHGQAPSDPAQAWGDCAADQSADRCYAEGLGVNWLITSPVDGGAPIAVARSFMFATGTQGLS